MGARQYAGTDANRTYSACVTAIDTWLTIEDLRTDDPGFQVEQDAADFYGIRCQRSIDFGSDCPQLFGTGLLVPGLIRFAQLAVGQFGDARDQRFVFRRGRPLDFRLAAIAHQFMDGIDD